MKIPLTSKLCQIFSPNGIHGDFQYVKSWYLADQNDTKKALILVFVGFYDQIPEFSYQPMVDRNSDVPLYAKPFM